ncbi:MAG TPA: ROK family protein, partial [Rhizobiales bacterium]|nr:ROK family protein [Hyphomicrobiales bacterium]
MQSSFKIGVDLGGTKIATIVLDRHASVVFESRSPTPKADYEQVIGSIVKQVDEARTYCPSTATIGIGIPGSQSPETGLIQNANSTWMNGRNFSKDIARALGQQIKIANDANCFALSEALDGAAKGANTVFGVIIGTGCGGGLVANGKLVTGRHAIGGEWGHTPLPWPGESEIPAPRCWCGRNGCLETWVSGSGMERDCRATTSNNLSAETISQKALNGDSTCQKILKNHCDRLARGLAMITNIIDPDVIVLGGGLSNMDHLYDQLPAR